MALNNLYFAKVYVILFLTRSVSNDGQPPHAVHAINVLGLKGLRESKKLGSPSLPHPGKPQHEVRTTLVPNSLTFDRGIEMAN